MIGTTERNAIHAWVVASSGLTADRVRWKRSGNGRAAQPAGCWISLQVVEERENGMSYAAGYTVPVAPVPGADLDFKRVQPMIGQLHIDCLLGDADWDTERPDTRVANVLRARNNPERARLLRLAGVGFGATQPTQTMDRSRDGVPDFMVRGRIALNYNDASHELGTWIEKVGIEAQISLDGDVYISETDEYELPLNGTLPMPLPGPI